MRLVLSDKIASTGEATQPTVGSLFSGIGGFDSGLELAGWQVVWQVENNPFRRSVLRRHWPEVELRNDIRTDTDGLDQVDLICGGFPCQDLSVAGRRKGLAGERSGLWFDFIRMVGEIRPSWVIIENVAGLLSSNEGRDFEVVVSGLAERGYGVAWRVLDSQHFGVAQRRRRVYVVGHLGAPCPPEILFEPESCGRDSETSRKTGRKLPELLAEALGIIATASTSTTTVPTSSTQGRTPSSESSRSTPMDTASQSQSRPHNPAQTDGGSTEGQPSPWMKSKGRQSSTARSTDRDTERGTSSDEHDQSTEDRPTAEEAELLSVRHLTPMECERLQGFPDTWTLPLLMVRGMRH